jgi:hypothetical protein
LIGESADRLSYIILQVGVNDRWVWKLHSSHNYTVKSIYNYLTAIGIIPDEGFNHLLWLKVVLLKVKKFVWCLFLNRLATKDNLCMRYAT